jgi:hypothetical protein
MFGNLVEARTAVRRQAALRRDPTSDLHLPNLHRANGHLAVSSYSIPENDETDCGLAPKYVRQHGCAARLRGGGSTQPSEDDCCATQQQDDFDHDVQGGVQFPIQFGTISYRLYSAVF